MSHISKFIAKAFCLLAFATIITEQHTLGLLSILFAIFIMIIEIAEMIEKMGDSK